MVDASCNNEKLWGEIDDTNEEFPQSWKADVLNNLEQEVIINSIKPIPFKTSFCSGENENSFFRKSHDVIVLDDVMKRTCKLLKFKADMKEIAEKGKFQQDFPNMEKMKNDILELCDNGDGAKNDRNTGNETSDFVEGIFTQPPPSITNESAVKVLRSSVSTILAFVGFSTTTMIPLQLLTEVAEDYIKRMARLLHVNVEKEMLDGEFGFSDALDRTCYEMGLGSVKNVAKHFKEETLVLNSKRIKETKKELAVYDEIIKKLREEKRQKSELSFVEMDEEDLVIPELHLTSISGSNMSSEPFEAGLQMLQTLERQQVMNMDLSSQPGCSSSSIITSLASIKTELEDARPPKRKRK